MKNDKKNLLLVSNYPSDTTYAWWLMEHFWCLLTEEVVGCGGESFIAYPKLKKLSESINKSQAQALELQVLKPTQKLKQFVREKHIDVVYFTDRGYFNPLYFYLKKWGVQTIIVHDHTPGDRPPAKGIKRFLKKLRNRLPFMTADAVFNVSELIRKRSIQTGCVPVHKTFTVQNGIDPISLSSSTRLQQRRSLGVSDDTIAIMTTGRAHPYKRFDFIVTVAKYLKEKYPDINAQFFLIGDGPQFQELKQMIYDFGLENTVHLLGYRGNIRELLQAGDIGFHASLGEAFSLSIIEYMSAKLPVFVPDIPTLCQAVTHMEDGCIYPWNDPEAAVEMLNIIIKDRDFLKQMGATARANASNIYSLEECSKQFTEVARSLIFR